VRRGLRGSRAVWRVIISKERLGETGLTGGQKSPCRSIISSAARKFAGRSRGMLGVTWFDIGFAGVFTPFQKMAIILLRASV
jgi:hypothetical protein